MISFLKPNKRDLKKFEERVGKANRLLIKKNVYE